MAERLTVFDRAELATDVGPNPRHITVLLVLGGPTPDVEEVRRRLARAVEAQPRLAAQVRAPSGPFRWFRAPTWQTGPVDLARHVTVRAAPGADPVTLAVDDLTRPLPAGRPAWRITVLDLGDAERSALLWTSHHLLGNGPSLLGLLLDTLTDSPLPAGWRTPGRRPVPGQASGVDGRVGRSGRPGPVGLVAHEDQGRPVGPAARAGLVGLVARLTPGDREGRAGRAAPSPLVRPITAGAVAVPVQVDAAAVRAGARTAGATVNDALLWAWARACGRADVALGGPSGRVVLSVPVTVPGSRFGNRLGTFRVAVPDPDEPPADGLAALAARTRRAKGRIRPWTWALAPYGARVVRRLGLMPALLHRQRLMTTVVTHAPGPPDALQMLGAPLVATVPLVPLVGNVTTCVAAVSISGRLDATVLCSPESAPAADALARNLRAGLDAVASLATPAGDDPVVPVGAPA
ncbi:wax ester/triacylglycerol synthase domain-containing protein [Cellulomonas biazotea]|uniref:diacylglycerol O-acyltransferase n=1 Tax=Cellulomonas biazotea TaxID=1709 RepID=A0A402DNH9_9CELL|nr:wax ester/triacylglycerol synthase domain-containing protein [Cellulomonas biazotea]GCE75687.1 hypothetical protein CBZ_07430 [Cellulomonas biazotea]